MESGLQEEGPHPDSLAEQPQYYRKEAVMKSRTVIMEQSIKHLKLLCFSSQ